MARKRSDQFGLDREEAVRKQKITIIAAAAGVLLCVAGIIAFVKSGGIRPGTSGAAPTSSAESAVVTATPTPTPEAERFPHVDLPQDPSYTQKLTIMSTGDNLIHEALYDDAESEEEERYYDFRPMYRLVKPYIEAADIATVNMETPLATSIGDPSGYPHFNSPKGAGYVLLDSGFDVINHANNHIMDMGTAGVEATLDYWAQYDMPVVGAYRSTNDMYTMRIIEQNGISVAFLGIAEFLNYDLPSDTSIRVPFFSDTEEIEDLIKAAKAAADVVVVHAHWGEENEDVVTETMEVFSQRMVDWGADIIFGNHTHIVQELRVLTRESDGQLCPVILSNGNFISGQKERSHLLSGLEYVTVAKDPDTGKIEIQNIEYLPVLTHYEGDRKNVLIYPLDLYTDELAASHGVADFEGEPMTIAYMEELLAAHIPDQFRVTTKTLSVAGAAERYASGEESSGDGETATESEAAANTDGEDGTDYADDEGGTDYADDEDETDYADDEDETDYADDEDETDYTDDEDDGSDDLE